MPDVRQYAQESLAEELTQEPVFASAEMPEPLGDEIVQIDSAPPMEAMPPQTDSPPLEVSSAPVSASFDLPVSQSRQTEFDLPLSQPRQTEFDLPLGPSVPLSRDMLETPARPVATTFDLPMGSPSREQIELLKTPEQRKTPERPLATNRPDVSEQSPLDVMMQTQRAYSEMSLRDFMAEHEWEELPLPQSFQTPYEPFPLPQNKSTEQARLDTPFVPLPAQPVMDDPPQAERAAGFSQAFPVEEEKEDSASQIREAIARDRQLYSMGQE